MTSRTKRIPIAISHEELRKLQVAAGSLGMPVSTYIRHEAVKAAEAEILKKAIGNTDG